MQNRIREIRKKMNMTQTEFGEALGVSRSVISTYEFGKVAPSQSVLKLLTINFNVDPHWLETGEGDMFLPMDTEDELMDFAQEINQSRDLEWVKQLVLTVKRLSPEQRAEVSRFVSGLAAVISQNTEKEHDS